MEGAEADGAYLNCPFTRDEYEAFIDALVAADQFHGHEFDEVPYFEGCMPVEVMAQRGRDTLRFGPMKPVGLTDPRTGRAPVGRGATAHGGPRAVRCGTSSASRRGSAFRSRSACSR